MEMLVADCSEAAETDCRELDISSEATLTDPARAEVLPAAWLICRLTADISSATPPSSCELPWIPERTPPTVSSMESRERPISLISSLPCMFRRTEKSLFATRARTWRVRSNGPWMLRDR